MKTVVAVVIASLFFAISADSLALVGRVNVTATVLDVRVGDVSPPGLSSGDSRSEVLRLWNKTVSDVPIGNGMIRCAFMGRGGAFGSRGVSYCTGTFTIGSRSKFGKISIAGPRRRFAVGNYVVVGGTGIYAGSGGSLHVRQGDVPGTLALTFNLVN
jgi:hypothetical protein